MELDLTPLAVFAVGMIVGGILPGIRAAVDRVFDWFEGRGLGRYDLENMAGDFVKAAEQMYQANDGDVKKAQVMEWMELELARRGVKMDLGLIEAAIEAAVYNLKNRE